MHLQTVDHVFCVPSLWACVRVRAEWVCCALSGGAGGGGGWAERDKLYGEAVSRTGGPGRCSVTFVTGPRAGIAYVSTLYIRCVLGPRKYRLGMLLYRFGM
jgi:hypothetical protein